MLTLCWNIVSLFTIHLGMFLYTIGNTVNKSRHKTYSAVPNFIQNKLLMSFTWMEMNCSLKKKKTNNFHINFKVQLRGTVFFQNKTINWDNNKNENLTSLSIFEKKFTGVLLWTLSYSRMNRSLHFCPLNSEQSLLDRCKMMLLRKATPEPMINSIITWRQQNVSSLFNFLPPFSVHFVNFYSIKERKWCMKCLHNNVFMFHRGSGPVMIINKEGERRNEKDWCKP